MPEILHGQPESLTFDMLREMIASLPPHARIEPESFQVRISTWAIQGTIVVLDPNWDWPKDPTWRPLVALIHADDAIREDSPQLILAAIAEFWRRRSEGTTDA